VPGELVAGVVECRREPAAGVRVVDDEPQGVIAEPVFSQDDLYDIVSWVQSVLTGQSRST
jgi:hypothetical protein